MLVQWRRLVLYVALGLTTLAVLFPPFSVNGGPDEYGFALSAPPSARQAIASMQEIGGTQAAGLAGQLVHYGIDVPRLLLELGCVWGACLVLRRTVLRPTTAFGAGEVR